MSRHYWPSLGVVTRHNSAPQWWRGGFDRKLGVAQGRHSPLPWGGGGVLTIVHSSCSRHQIPSDTMNCLFPNNTFLPRTYYFFQISQPTKICLKNRYFEEQIHWVPLSIDASADACALISLNQFKTHKTLLLCRFY